jgi:hypothetical protein
MYLGHLIDDGVEKGRAVNLGVPHGVVERLRSDEDETADGGEGFPASHDVACPATLIVKRNDHGQGRVGIGSGGNLIAVVSLLAFEGEGAVLDFVFALRRSGQGGQKGEEKTGEKNGTAVHVSAPVFGSEVILTKPAVEIQ